MRAWTISSRDAKRLYKTVDLVMSARDEDEDWKCI